MIVHLNKNIYYKNQKLYILCISDEISTSKHARPPNAKDYEWPNANNKNDTGM